MHWIENAVANVNLEAVNDMLMYAIYAMQVFYLNMGDGQNTFEITMPIDVFSDAIFYLAYTIIIVAVLVKLWIAMASPFDTAEEPGAVFVRFIAAGIGIAAAKPLFEVFQSTFNVAYRKFTGVYVGITQEYEKLPWNQWRVKREVKPIEEYQSRKDGGDGSTGIGATAGDKDDAFNLFGGDKLLGRPTSNLEQNLGVLLLELIIGCTLVICFFRLILEVYERYVLLGLMYFTAPLAFASIIGKDSQIFKNWLQMVLTQFILMATNLLFIGGFIKAWTNIMNNFQANGFVFNNEQDYFTTMFILIGWLVLGQKLDQHLKGLGLSTAQTGAGLMAAMAGGALMARTALGVAGSAIGTVGGGARKAINGQLPEQKAFRDRTGWASGIGRATEHDGAKSSGSIKTEKPDTPKADGTLSSPTLTPGPMEDMHPAQRADNAASFAQMERAGALPEGFDSSTAEVSPPEKVHDSEGNYLGTTQTATDANGKSISIHSNEAVANHAGGGSTEAMKSFDVPQPEGSSSGPKKVFVQAQEPRQANSALKTIENNPKNK